MGQHQEQCATLVQCDPKNRKCGRQYSNTSFMTYLEDEKQSSSVSHFDDYKTLADHPPLSSYCTIYCQRLSPVWCIASSSSYLGLCTQMDSPPPESSAYHKALRWVLCDSLDLCTERRGSSGPMTRSSGQLTVVTSLTSEPARSVPIACRSRHDFM